MRRLLENGVTPAPCWTRFDLALIASLTLIALALRIPGLDQGLWFDEISTLVNHVRLPIGEIISQYSMNNHVLYSVSAHGVISWFGESAWAVRLPALLFGVATIPAAYYLGRQIASREEALLAVFLMVFNYHHIWFSQNARGYTGLALGAILSTVIFIRLISMASPPIRLAVAYAVVTALTAWIHLTAVFIILAHGSLWFALSVKSLPSLKKITLATSGMALILTGLFSLLLYAPIIPEAVSPARTGDGGQFIAHAEASRWAINEIVEGVNRAIPGGWLSFIVVASFVIAGLMSYAKQSFAVLWLLLFPAVITAVVVAVLIDVVFPRFLFGSVAFFVLIAVRGGFKLAGIILPFLSPRHVLLLGALVVLSSAVMIPKAWEPKQDFKSAAEYVENHRAAGDAVVCISMAYLPLSTYLGVQCENVKTLADLKRIEDTHKRTWLIYTLTIPFSVQMPEIWEWINTQSGYHLEEAFEGSLSNGDISVMLKQ